MPKPFGFELSGMVALQSVSNQSASQLGKWFKLRWPFILVVAQEDSKENSIAMQGRIAYLILDIMRDKFVRVRIYKR